MEKQYTTEEPIFSDSIRKLLTTDKAHADVFNEIFKTLITNDTFLNNLAEKMIQKESMVHDSETSDQTKVPSSKVTAHLQSQLKQQNVDIERNTTDLLGLSEQLSQLSDKTKKVYSIEIMDRALDLDYSQIIEQYFNSLPLDCTIILNISTKKSYCTAIIQRYYTEDYGSALVFGYAVPTPRFRRFVTSEWHDWVDLYEDPDNRKLKVDTLPTVDAMNQYYDGKHTNSTNGMWYRSYTSHEVLHPVLQGGAFYLEGVRTSVNYGWQKLSTYNGTGITYVRSIQNGVWSAWKSK